MTDAVTARDETFAAFKAAWNAKAAIIVTNANYPLATDRAKTGGSIAWPMYEPTELPPGNTYWARVSFQIVVDGAASLGGSQGGGKKKYLTAGVVFVQCFGPMGDPTVGDKLYRLALAARDAFRGVTTASGVIFRDAKATPVSADGKFQQWKVSAEFEFFDVA